MLMDEHLHSWALAQVEHLDLDLIHSISVDLRWSGGSMRTGEASYSNKTVFEIGEYALLDTYEIVHVPNNSVVHVSIIGSLARDGFMMMPFVIQPGSEGTITVPMHNLSHKRLTLRREEPLVQISVEELERSTRVPYSFVGRYNNTKAPTPRTYHQVSMFRKLTDA